MYPGSACKLQRTELADDTCTIYEQANGGDGKWGEAVVSGGYTLVNETWCVRTITGSLDR